MTGILFIVCVCVCGGGDESVSYEHTCKATKKILLENLKWLDYSSFWKCNKKEITLPCILTKTTKGIDLWSITSKSSEIILKIIIQRKWFNNWNRSNFTLQYLSRCDFVGTGRCTRLLPVYRRINTIFIRKLNVVKVTFNERQPFSFQNHLHLHPFRGWFCEKRIILR